MNADLILDAFEKIDDKYIIEAKGHRLMDANIISEIWDLQLFNPFIFIKMNLAFYLIVSCLSPN